MLKFEWNLTKARANLKKHGVSFEEAQSVFFDENAIQFFDSESSFEEERFLMLGLSENFRIFCEREGEVIRIISARRATASERKHYTGA
ncbi:MAG: hypothetical protein RLZZ227_2926 [Pseudomonadota bacterium]|jgi:uncharacterized DUF497 family protein